jgi:hypothetical protein
MHQERFKYINVQWEKLVHDQIVGYALRQIQISPKINILIKTQRLTMSKKNMHLHVAKVNHTMWKGSAPSLICGKLKMTDQNGDI